MDIVRLRTMAERSVFDSGKYQGKTVFEILNANPAYLIFVYYNYSKVSFTEDILNKLKILKRIEKPGTDKDYFSRKFGSLKFASEYDKLPLYKLKKLIAFHSINFGSVPKALLHAFRRAKSKKIRQENMPHVYTKRSLQGKNHGR